jgi:hypothetical protein
MSEANNDELNLQRETLESIYRDLSKQKNRRGFSKQQKGMIESALGQTQRILNQDGGDHLC